MDSYIDEPRPVLCHAAGLECRSCARSNAQTLANVCGGLIGISLEKAFFQMFADPACACMLNDFAASYHAATVSTLRKPCGAAAAA